MRSRLARTLLSLSLLLTVSIVLRASLGQVETGSWGAGPNLSQARTGANVVALNNGDLLITGGMGPDGPLATAEILHADGTVTVLPSMTAARAHHAGALLGDGRVLIAGGDTSSGAATNEAEIFDPKSNTWTSAPPLGDARSHHIVIPVPDGRALVAGGTNSSGAVATVEVFEPWLNEFTTVGMMSQARQDLAASLLDDGRILLLGGSNDGGTLASTDVYDPWLDTVEAGPNMTTARASATATLLHDGTVLVVGGNNGDSDLASAEIYDGSSFHATGSMSGARAGHLALRLPKNNQVLIVGGTQTGTPLTTTELYVPWNGAFKSAAELPSAREGAFGSPLTKGKLVVAGGSDSSTSLYGFATLATDKIDYQPGELVSITGTGWQPGETVTMRLHEVPTIDPDATLTATADANGTFVNTDFTPDFHDIGITFELTATGTRSTAQLFFTDAPSPTMDNVTILKGECSTEIKISGVTNNASVALSTTPPGQGTFYNDSNCSTSVTSVTANSRGVAVTRVKSTNAPLSYTMNAVWSGGSTTGTAKIGVLAFSNPATNANVNDCTRFTVKVDGIGSGNLDTAIDAALSVAPAVGTFGPNEGGFFYTDSGCTNQTSIVNQLKDTKNVYYKAISSGTHVISVHAFDTTATASIAITDNVPPTVTLLDLPSTWQKGDVTGSVKATDNNSVASLSCTIDGTATQLTISGLNTTTATAPITVSGEGTHTVICNAKDAANNAATPATATVKIDSTAPTVNCDPPDTLWHKSNVSISCTASDATSNLANSADATFTLSTNISGPTETSIAQTGTHDVCDNAGNCVTAGPITGIKIDNVGPQITATAKKSNDATYVADTWSNLSVTVTFACTDGGGSGVDTTSSPEIISSETAGQNADGSCKDLAGNVASTSFGPVKIDMTKPKPPTFEVSPTPNANQWNNADVAITFTSAGDAGTVMSDVASCTAPVSVTTEGTTDHSGTCTDNAGNVSDPVKVTINLDKTKPTISALAKKDNGDAYSADTWTNQPVTVTFSCTDTGSGMDSSSIPTPTTLSTETEGTSVPGSCKDLAGNEASTAFGPVKIDITPPNPPGYSLSPEPNANGWNKTPVTIKFESAGDAGTVKSGVATCTGDISVTEEGATSHSGTCTDFAGNVSMERTVQVKIDTKPPTISVSAVKKDGTPYLEGTWTNQEVTVTFDCSDTGGSGVLPGSIKGSGSVSTEGENTLSGSCEDLAGNTATKNFVVKLDTVPPNYSCDKPDGLWHKDDVAIACSANDPTPSSGLAADANFNLVTSVAADTETNNASTNSHQVCDTAGNCTTAGPVSGNMIDKKAPTVTASATVNGNPYTAGTWTNQNVTISFQCQDFGSGVGTVDPSKVVSTETTTAGASVSGNCTDKVGNTASTAFGPVLVDKTAPVVQVTGMTNGAIYTMGDPIPTLGCSTSDALSGVATNATLSVTGGNLHGAGTFTATCSGALDKAGNPGSGSLTYYIHYRFLGFFSPVNMDIWNSTKAGQTVPMKWQLLDGNGAYIIDLNTARGGYTTEVCTPGPSDAVETSDTSGASGLRYDSIANQYIFTWQTVKGWSGCRKFILTLDDGTTHVAHFTFR